LPGPRERTLLVPENSVSPAFRQLRHSSWLCTVPPARTSNVVSRAPRPSWPVPVSAQDQQPSPRAWRSSMSAQGAHLDALAHAKTALGPSAPARGSASANRLGMTLTGAEPSQRALHSVSHFGLRFQGFTMYSCACPGSSARHPRSHQFTETMIQITSGHRSNTNPTNRSPTACRHARVP